MCVTYIYVSVLHARSGFYKPFPGELPACKTNQRAGSSPGAGSEPPVVDSVSECVPLTEQDDDADEDGYDGSRAQASGGHSSCGGAVSILVTGTHLHPDHRPVGQGRVPRVRHGHRDVVHPRFQVGDPESQLGVITYESTHTHRSHTDHTRQCELGIVIVTHVESTERGQGEAGGLTGIKH